MKTIVLFLSAMFTLSISNAQYSQNFEGTVSTLAGNCLTLTDVHLTNDPADVINGNGSLYTNPPVNGSGTRDITTPALIVPAGNLVISFNYKPSNQINGNATRTIEIGLMNVSGTFTSLHMVTLDRNSPTTAQAYSGNFNQANSGLYKIVLRLGGSQGDGNCRLIFDDLYVNATPRYGSVFCNSAPIAVNDIFLGVIGSMVAGNVMINDSEPNEENMSAAIVATSADGTVVLNANGSFTFTPNQGFVGATTTFTYQLSDDGFSPAASNIATVTINFSAPTSLPVKFASFTATLNNNKADLKWSTVSEVNVNHFMIERSYDGTNFGDAGMMFAYGNSTDLTNYSFSDNLSTTTAKVIYYRIRSVDTDGRTNFTETKIIRLGKEQTDLISILTYPNPVSNELRVTIPAAWQNKKVLYEIFNSNGSVARKTESANAGQTETLNVSTLASGFYLVRVSCDGQSAQQKIVKH